MSTLRKAGTVWLLASIILFAAVPVRVQTANLPPVVGDWYMGTASGFDCNLHLRGDHTLTVQYGGCFHQDPPLLASWDEDNNRIWLWNSEPLQQKLGNYLTIVHYKNNIVLVPEREESKVQQKGYSPHWCFWKNLLGVGGLELPKAAYDSM